MKITVEIPDDKNIDLGKAMDQIASTADKIATGSANK
jgi:hypothetical protein